MSDFKERHFEGEAILWAVRWYCRYPSSYRDLEQMLSVDHSTIYRWMQHNAPEMDKRLHWFWRRGFDPSWRLDETYIRVCGSGHSFTRLRQARQYNRLLPLAHAQL